MNHETPTACTHTQASDSQRTASSRLRPWIWRAIGAMAIGLFIFTALVNAWSTDTYAAPLGQTVPPPDPTVPTVVPTVPPVPTAPTVVPTVPPGTIPPFDVIYLGFKTSDEIEFDDDEQDDFIYKNEDIVAFIPGATAGTGAFSIFFDGSACGLSDANLDDFEVLANGNIIFTLRAQFDIPGLGPVDDSDVVEYTPADNGCGTFAFRLKGADVGLTKGAEDIDGLGIDANGNLLISTIGTAKVPGATGELEAKDQDILKLDAGAGTWSLYFDGSDVALTENSEDIRSIAMNVASGTLTDPTIYLTLSGDFDVTSDNADEGDKNDVEGCTPSSLGESATACFFFKFLDGESINAENQLDGLSIQFGVTQLVSSGVAGTSDDASVEATEAALEAADIAELLAEGDSEVSADDLGEVLNQIYLPMVKQ